MVCRHIFFICSLENIKDVGRLLISDRWLLSLEKSETSHFAIDLTSMPLQSLEPIQTSKDNDLDVNILEIESTKPMIIDEEAGVKKVEIQLKERDQQLPNGHC